MKVTLKNLNKEIANPLGVELVKGHLYYYLVDLPDRNLMGYAENTIIYVFMLSQFTFEQWKEVIVELVENAKALKKEARDVDISKPVRLQWGK